MDREWGAQDALAFVRRTDFAPSARGLRRGDAAAHELADRRQRPRPRGGRDPGDRRRDARLRLHGQGALERVPEDRLHDLAAAARPRLVAIAGRNEEAVAAAAERYGYERWTTDWRDMVADPAIGLFDNGGPNSSTPSRRSPPPRPASTSSARSRSAATADESFEIWQRVAATGVKHLCAFNYRFVPAVRLAREMIDAGELGEIRHFRGRYLQDWGDDPSLDTWRFHADEAGSGALGDLGAHVVDLARFLVGEIASVSALVKTFLPGPARSTTRSRRPSSSRTARSGRSSRRASRSAAATRSSGRSTARRARSPSTWSG